MKFALPSIDPNSLKLCMLCLVGFSTFFPVGLNRDSRRAVESVAQLRRELESVRLSSASNTVVVIEALRGFRDEYSAPVGASDAVPDGAASARVYERGSLPTLSGNYFSTASGSGAFIAGQSYLVGDMSPWGIVDDAFRGGCVIDGQRFILQRPPPRERLKDE